MEDIDRVKDILMGLGLNLYQASLLTYLLHLGESKATVLSRVSKVPTAKVYEVLDELIKMGLVMVRPGRPALYSPVSPEEIVNNLIAWKMEMLRKSVRDMEVLSRRFLDIASRIYLRGVKGPSKSPLIRIVPVGDVSEEETRRLYNEAGTEILILSQAYEYYPRVSKALNDALDRGVNVKLILKDPSKLDTEFRERQEDILRMLDHDSGGRVEVGFVDDVPLRGCIIDPRGGGKAIFMVEEPDIPFEFREAAITSNPGLVRALALMFNLLWRESRLE
jgi:sugar-specific transcriptional regulator TrmB